MAVSKLLYKILSPLTKTPRPPKNAKLTGTLLLRATIWGAILYSALGRHHLMNLELNMISLLMATVWAYFDGIASRRDWARAASEGFFIHLIGVQVSNFLLINLNYPS